jgi:fatty-acyl-CoA synthase
MTRESPRARPEVSPGSAPPPPAGEAVGVRDRLRRAFSEHANRTAIVTERRISTFRDLEERVLQLAAVVRGLGCGVGDMVGFVLTPRPDEICDLRLASFEAGTTLFLIPPTLDCESMGEMLRSAAPKLVFYDSAHLPGLPRVLEDVCSGSRAVPLAGGKESLRELMRGVGAQRGASADEPGPGELASIGFTSGTTGPPKGVTSTYAAFSESSRMMLEILARLGARAGEGFFNGIPMFAAGGGLLVPALCAGLTQHLPQRWDPARALSRIEEARIAWAFLTPSEILDLLDQPLERRDLRSLRGIVYGSAPMPAARLREAVDRLPLQFLQGYGMSECFPPVAVLWPEEHGTREKPASRDSLASSGRPYPGIAVRIDGEGPGPGEILISSPTVTAGYWKDPDRTAGCLEEGWFRSGDFGSIDGEGRLHVLGRKEDLLRRGSKDVFPRPIEEAVSEHPIVKEVCAVGTGKSDRIVAVVSLRPPYRKDPETARRALKDWLESRLPREEIPDDVRILEELPRGVQGKVVRREVRQALGSR